MLFNFIRNDEQRTLGNEEHNIVAAIKSVDFANEIMVVDSFSTDQTIALATPLATTILQRKYENSSSQKNWAIPQAKYEWILLLDADERVTHELKEEVQKTINSNTEFSCFFMFYTSNSFLTHAFTTSRAGSMSRINNYRIR